MRPKTASVGIQCLLLADTIDEDVTEQEECDNESDNSAASFSDYVISTGESTAVLRVLKKIRSTTRLSEIIRKPHLRNHLVKSAAIVGSQLTAVLYDVAANREPWTANRHRISTLYASMHMMDANKQLFFDQMAIPKPCRRTITSAQMESRN